MMPSTGVGSTAETNRLLGGNYFDTTTGAQVTPPPTAPVVPTTSTSVTAPASSPTAVTSSGLAASNVTGAVSSTVTNAQSAIDAQAAKNAADAKAAADAAAAAKATSTPSNSQSTAERQIANTPDPGQMFVYDKATGTRSEIPVGQALSSNQTMTDVMNAGAQDTVSNGSTTYKQFADGTYGAYDDNGNYIGAANASTFASAKGSAKALSDLSAIQNGTYPLSAGQQAQMDQVASYYQGLIEKQQTENANVTGNVTGIQNLFGVGGTSVGTSAINQTIADGAAKIAEINRQMVNAIAALKSSIQTDDINLVKSQYSEFQNNVDAKQKTIDQIHSEVVNAGIKADQNQATQNDFFAKKYSDTTTAILPTDTNDQMMAKLKTSPRWNQDQQVASSLNADETKFWADMATTGVSLSSIMPNLGIGTAFASTKIAILKQIADDAQKVGLTAQNVADSIADKRAKVSTYAKLQQQGTQLAAQEAKTESDFQLVKSAGAKIKDTTLQSGVTFLQNWINSGTLQTTGNPELNNYLGLLTTALTNYARVVAGQTGAAATTAQMNTEIQGIINKGLTVAAVNSYIDNAAIPEMKNTVNGYDTTMKSLMNQLNLADGTINATATAGGIGVGDTTSGSSTSGGSSGSTYISPSGKTFTLPNGI